jgi:hypothetical protein
MTSENGLPSDRRRRAAAPVLCAEVLLHHDLSDDAIIDYLARAWPLREVDCRAALDAAHILLRRELAHELR